MQKTLYFSIKNRLRFLLRNVIRGSALLSLQLWLSLGTAQAGNFSIEDQFRLSLNNSVYAMALAPDGTVVVGGDFTFGSGGLGRAARISQSYFKSFNAQANGQIAAVAVQPDGKVLLAGNFLEMNNISRVALARVNANGSLDTGFTPLIIGRIFTIALQEDGKILIGGVFSSVDGQARNNIARLNSNGSLDAGFNPSTNSTVYSLSIQRNGKNSGRRCFQSDQYLRPK